MLGSLGSIRRLQRLALIALTALLGVYSYAATAHAVTPQIASGDVHSCVVDDQGTVKCWGNNGNSQSGGPHGQVNTIPFSGPAASIAAGGDATCALLATGAVECIGLNTGGALGPPTPATVKVPKEVPLGQPAVKLSMGSGYTCAILKNGSLVCFGFNSSGQLGVVSGNSATPLTVALGAPATVIAAGWAHTCVVLVDGLTRCWGLNNLGQLGITQNAAVNSTPQAPVAIDSPPTKIANGRMHSCGVRATGGLQCWGSNTEGQLGSAGANLGSSTQGNPTPVTVPLAGVIDVDTGDYHTCALLTSGEVDCFGRNQQGQLGNANDAGGAGFQTFPSPSKVNLLEPALAISAGTEFNCAIARSGIVQCWGDNGFRQLAADNEIKYSYAPLTVPGLNVFHASAAGGKLAAKFSKLRFKSRFKNGKRKISATSTLAATGMTAALCAGKVKAVVRSGKRKAASKSFKLKFKKAKCSASIAIKLARKYKNRKLKVTTSVTGSATLTAPAKTWTVKP